MSIFSFSLSILSSLESSDFDRVLVGMMFLVGFDLPETWSKKVVDVAYVGLITSI